LKRYHTAIIIGASACAILVVGIGLSLLTLIPSNLMAAMNYGLPTPAQQRLDRAMENFEIGRNTSNFSNLRRTTFQVIKEYPDDLSVTFFNTADFYERPEYLNEVIALLKSEEPRERGNGQYYYILGKCCTVASVPPLQANGRGKSYFLNYFGLPKSTTLRTSIDRPVANEAVGYYEKALKAAPPGTFAAGETPEALASLLHDIGHDEEAVKICRQSLPSIPQLDKPDFLVIYGRCLHAVHRDNDAVAELNQVRGCDTEGFDNGPAHATMRAEMELGLIALDAGDIKSADKHLLASCSVQKCCHLISQGLPLTLATRLLAKGQNKVVAQFCTESLATFVSNDPETEALLKRATANPQAEL